MGWGSHWPALIEDEEADNGEGVIQILLGLAVDHGYSRCEIRNYARGVSDSYLDADAFDPITKAIEIGL
jgi:hypothetical protein